ncbi:hypothetical protein TVAG_105990 [Trichomonas vaginalis G3]|uniref:JAB1/MPN/MOV34 metalloenzyme domain-containing protein n=1 Tax=Trichomonas vaginalis (strain ATCC PRA-98 / G3) TaxID=412133 RepID=A2G273_TRIV3|nr:Eukaryotic translation initiation factor 3 subunit H domain-containing protein [Trichomonas vaginalis G3]EAX88751.1 hypothetical protein TVAG_105990 [Trichomonas vaginalis G3]KAI5523640.1 Eukaryotic translation initiation factor 3 subunit H domain-containing protein [Trichomonas vaginalis G3]|eukprot:XP_001301681.1 hypothetical protein [Trichomonas vaginalis G3]
MENKTPDSITISPRAIFEIIKDIQSGRSGSDAQGYLYGLPENPIEVTSAFPAYSLKAEPSETADDIVKEEYRNSIKNFQKTHLEELKALNCDYEHVGRYTSRNVGGRIHFRDLNRQWEEQVETSSDLFTLVVTINGSSLSTRAFRVSEEACEFMKEHDINEIGYIDPVFFYDRFVQELQVTFALTKLDEALIQEMLSRFNLISDVFILRDMNAMQDQMIQIYDSLDKIKDEVTKATADKFKIEENRAARKQWVDERKEKNLSRIAHKLEPLPLEDVDKEIPKLDQSRKRDAIDNIYDFKARADAILAELKDEEKKIDTLSSLSAQTEKK